FECPDPWWLGPERIQTLRLNPGSKPFLSEGAVSRRNLVPNPFGPGASGVDYWRTTRGELSADVVDGDFAARFTQSVDSGAGYMRPPVDFRPPAGSVFRASVEVKVETDADMRLTVRGYGGAEPSDTGSEYRAQSPDDGWVEYVTEVEVGSMPDGAYLWPLIWPTNASFREGEKFWIRRMMVEVDPPEGATYFDGDSSGCKWVDGADGPESVMWDPEQTTPFFPIVLAESVVQGSWTVDVGGEGPVSPVWE